MVLLEKVREKKKECLYAREREVRQTICKKRSLIVLKYKEAYLNLSKHNSSLPNVVFSLLREYKDVFPKEIPNGILSLKGIEHQIDFIPGVLIPNHPAYQSNSYEMKELQWQGTCSRVLEPMCYSYTICFQKRWFLEHVCGLQSRQ